jgi:hypothetical protein
MNNVDAAQQALTAIREALGEPVKSEIPDHGVEAAKVINKYAEHAADFIDKTADDIMQEVVAYKEACTKLSQEMRRITEAHAQRTMSLTARLRDAATGVSKVTQEFFGDAKSK